MTIDDEQLWRDLAVLDPASTDAPPAPGSPRYAAVFDRAKGPDVGEAPEPPKPATGAKIGASRQLTGRRALLAVAAAGVLIVGVVAAGRLGSVDPASATELVTEAAHATGDASSFRGQLVVEEDEGVRSSELVVDGADIQVTGDGNSASFTAIDDLFWEGDDPTPSTFGPEDRLAPFAPSSEAVILAALRSEDTVEIGQEEVRGQPTTHYRITLDEASRTALSRLSPGELAWFELEYPEEALTVDVWVGDDGLIRRIRVVSDWEAGGTGSGDITTTTEFYDFGAEVSITPPA